MLDKIIPQLVMEMTEEIIKVTLECKLNLERATPRILELIKRRATEIMQYLIEMTDKSLLEDKAGRRKEGWLLRGTGTSVLS